MSLWNPFRRSKPTPPPSDPKINEDWQVGDMAECIKEFPLGITVPSVPLVGEIYVVADVTFGESWDTDGNRFHQEYRFGLKLRGHHLGGLYWNCVGFRKVFPVKDVETLDIGLSETIKRCNPAPVKVGSK